jgi:hypothetical protein
MRPRGKVAPGRSYPRALLTLRFSRHERSPAPEPELEFGLKGQNVDIRYGLLENGVLDRDAPSAPKRLPVDVVGTPETLEGREGVDPKATDLETLFPAFPGYGPDHPFYSKLVTAEVLQRRIPKRRIDLLVKMENLHGLVRVATQEVLPVAQITVSTFRRTWLRLRGGMPSRVAQTTCTSFMLPRTLRSPVVKWGVSHGSTRHDWRSDEIFCFHRSCSSLCKQVEHGLQVLVEV